MQFTVPQSQHDPLFASHLAQKRMRMPGQFDAEAFDRAAEMLGGGLDVDVGGGHQITGALRQLEAGAHGGCQQGVLHERSDEGSRQPRSFEWHTVERAVYRQCQVFQDFSGRPLADSDIRAREHVIDVVEDFRQHRKANSAASRLSSSRHGDHSCHQESGYGVRAGILGRRQATFTLERGEPSLRRSLFLWFVVWDRWRASTEELVVSAGQLAVVDLPPPRRVPIDKPLEAAVRGQHEV